MTKLRESDVMTLISDYLRARRILAFRNNVMVAKFGDRFVKAGVPGMADWVAYPAGRVVWIEAKAPGEKQKPAQESFQKIVEDAGQHIHRGPELGRFESGGAVTGEWRGRWQQ